MESRTRTNGPHGRTEESVAELIQRATRQTQTLVRDEMRLAQLELTEKGKRAGLGAGLFGGAGGLAAYGFGALLAGLILLLATAVEGWLAAFIVSAVLFVVAGVLALAGKREIEQATPPRPEAAAASARQDVDEVKARARK
jgi:MFS family permease